MYKILYLKSALDDLEEIISYIIDNYKDLKAAKDFKNKCIDKIDSLASFPYAYPLYIPIRELKYEYRKIVIDNYLLFYYVKEEEKTVYISRIIYSKRKINLK